MTAVRIDNPPPGSAPRAEALNNLREGSTARLRRRLSGDLDTIVLRALNKEPQRRYVAVEQFAEDIRRHLEGLPVTARRDSWTYRAGKFARRHKLGVSATVLVLAAVLGGVAATVREARIAAVNERRAEQRFNDVRKLANSLMFEIHDAIRDLPGSTPARRLLVTRALEYLDSLSQQSKDDISLQKELAAAYERVGDVLGYPYGANLGDKPGALQSYRKALAIREPLAAASANDLQFQRDLVGNYFRVAQVLDSSGNFADALEALRKLAPSAQRLAAGNTDPVSADSYAGVYYFTAAIQSETGNSAAALENYRRSAAIREAGLQANPDNFTLRTHLAADYGGIARCMELNSDLPGAIQMQSKAAAILDELSKAHPDNATVTEYLGESTNRLSTYRSRHGETAAALESFRRSHQIFHDLLAADPKNSLAKSNFGFSDNGIANCLLKLGQPAAAAKIYRESIASFEEMSPRTVSTRYPRTGLADAYAGLGAVYEQLATGKRIPSNQKREYWQEAVSNYQKSLAIWAEKQKRGEMESGELKEPSRLSASVAKGEEQLRSLGAR